MLRFQYLKTVHIIVERIFGNFERLLYFSDYYLHGYLFFMLNFQFLACNTKLYMLLSAILLNAVGHTIILRIAAPNILEWEADVVG